jgi:hypothetical protein
MFKQSSSYQAAAANAIPGRRQHPQALPAVRMANGAGQGIGHGKAAKEQVQHMVVKLLSLAGAPSADAADALACAICHAHGGQGLGMLATAGYRVRGGRLIG